MIAALYVESGGCYFGLEGVDPWDVTRDARTYAGPSPVVAHPPCARWGRFWFGGPQWLKDGNPRKVMGDDGGCFAAALAAVRKFGGVLEHPADSNAWNHFNLNRPPRSGGWISAGFEGGWTCYVEQGHYGHKARKATWLYAHGCDLPALIWGRAPQRVLLAGLSKARRERDRRTGIVQCLSKRQRLATPVPFRDLLLSIARTAIRPAQQTVAA